MPFGHVQVDSPSGESSDLKAPLCKGSCRSEAETEGLFSYRTASVHVEIQFTPLQQPFRLLLRKIHLPLHRGGKIVDSLKNACHPERMRRISERKHASQRRDPSSLSTPLCFVTEADRALPARTSAPQDDSEGRN